MGLCLGKTASSSPCWPDLPRDMVGVILSCLASKDDRLSLAAVCREFRLAALEQQPILPPAMPWISLGNDAYQSIADGNVRRTRRGAVSFGSRLMYEQQDGRIYMCDASLSVIEIPRHYHRCSDRCHNGVTHDPRSTAEARRTIGPCIANAMHKVVVCSPDLVAALVDPFTGRPEPEATANSLAFFRPVATGQLSWALCTPVHRYKDMVLYRGKIFALSFSDELYAHELRQPCLAEHVIMETPWPEIYATECIFLVKLVVSSDGQKLLMVRWNIPEEDCIHRTSMNLQVFEADLDKREWLEVQDLDGQVVFLSKTCSRALAGSSTKLYDPRFREGNRVFILGFDWAWMRTRYNTCTCGDDCVKSVHDVPSYCVYDMMRRRLSLVSLGKRHGMRNLRRSEWFFPSE